MTKEKQMKMSVRVTALALALGVAALSVATILPAAAKCIMSEGDCGSTAAGIAAATMGSASSAGSAGSAGGGGSLSYDQILAGLGLPPEEVLRNLAELQKQQGYYYNYGHEKRDEPTFIGSDGQFVADIAGPSVHCRCGRDAGSNKKNENNSAKVLKLSTGTASTVTANVNADRKAPPTTASANVFGGAMNAPSLAVSSASLDHPVGKAAPAPKKLIAAPAPKKPVPVRIISASTQAQATAQQLVAHPQPLGPVGSSSMNARQKALSAGSH